MLTFLQLKYNFNRSISLVLLYLLLQAKDTESQAKLLFIPPSAGGKCLMLSPLCCWPAEHAGLPLWDALTALHSLPKQDDERGVKIY